MVFNLPEADRETVLVRRLNDLLAELSQPDCQNADALGQELERIREELRRGQP